MYQLTLVIHVLAAIALVGLVLLQQGKGAAMGSAYGSGASQTVFGSRGSGSFLLKLTAVLALTFFSTSLVLNRMATHQAKHGQQTALSMPVPHSPLQRAAHKTQHPHNSTGTAA